MKEQGRNFVIIAWLLFLLCLILPAIYSASGRIILGYEAAILAQTRLGSLFDVNIFSNTRTAYSAVANMSILFLPFVLLIKKQMILKTLTYVFIFYFIVTISFQYEEIINEGIALGIGYYIWVFSFMLAAYGLYKMSKIPNNRILPDILDVA